MRWAIAAALLLGPGATAPTLASDAPAGRPHSGTMARPIERKLPAYPEREVTMQQEGWVILSYVVAEDGSVRDVLVDESSGVLAFERAARRAAEKWRYEPATLNGEPTQQCHTRVLMPFAIDLRQSERGARGKVVRRYRKASRALEKGDLDEARRLIAETREKVDLNLYEGARLAFLESLIARASDDAEGERNHLRWALIGKGQYIEDELAAAAWQRLFVLDVESRRFASAIDTYEQMQEAMDDEPIPEWVTEKVAALRGLSGRDGRYGVPARIPEPRTPDEAHGVWVHQMLLRTVGFESDSLDAIEEFDLRCDFHRAKGRPKKDRAIRVPEEWGSCFVFVFGEPGTEFELIEYSGTP